MEEIKTWAWGYKQRKRAWNTRKIKEKKFFEILSPCQACKAMRHRVIYNYRYGFK